MRCDICCICHRRGTSLRAYSDAPCIPFGVFLLSPFVARRIACAVLSAFCNTLRNNYIEKNLASSIGIASLGGSVARLRGTEIQTSVPRGRGVPPTAAESHRWHVAIRHQGDGL